MRNAEEKRNYRNILFIALFIAYSFLAADIIPRETVFTARWIVPVDLKNTDAARTNAGALIPFELSGTFGYVDESGAFSFIKEKKAYISYSSRLWAEYGGKPDKIPVYDSAGARVVTLDNPGGYPFFLDDRIFVVNNEQYSIARLNEEGGVLWSWDFAAPVTCVDAAAGIVAAGLLDGGVEILGPDGERLFSSVPTGSRIAAVYNCALSADGTALAALSGIDPQRFLLFERFGATWRVTYHQFLEDGLRRPAYVLFVDNGRRVVFEREDGLGIYDRHERAASRIRLDGRVTAMDDEGGGGMLLLLTSDADAKERLIAIAYPGTVVMEAPFEGPGAFLKRRGDLVFAGGADTLASFRIERR